MVKLTLGNAVNYCVDASYFVRPVDGGEGTYQNCMEISQGYAWTSKDPTMLEALAYKDPTMLEALAYIIDRAAKDTQKRRTDELQETAAEDLHLEAHPFATGWSGNIVRGTISRHRIAVKLALSIRAEALINEARAYNRLKQYWGRYLPKLILHVYIATEFVIGFPIGIEPLTEAVAVAAVEALNAVHAFGMLHGDIREDNILVVKGGV